MDNQKTLLILLVAATFCSTDQTLVCREASVADIVFLVDGSWSIGDKNFKSMQDFLYTMVSSFDVGEDKIRVGLIQYSNAPTTEFFLNTYHHKEDILKKIQKLHYQGGGTKTGESLQFMLENHFKETAGSRMEEGVPQIAVMITDGQAQDNIREPARKVKDAGITLYAIGIKDASLEELQEIVSEPADKHVYKVEDFTALQDISHGILQVLCTTVEEVNRQITHVSQVCRKATLADIVFLVDTSTSIGPENFQKVKNFLYTLVSRLDVSSDQVRVGLAQYSDETFKEFLLNQYSLKSDILEQIQNLPYRSGGSYTGSALDFVRTTYFTESAGSRALENVPQIVILVTDGESSDQIKIPANNLKARGISVYVVGINVQDVTELQEIANKPLNKFLFNIDNYDVLQDLPKSILKTVCFAVESQLKAFTKHYADIVFLVDSSVNVGSSTFEQIKNFIYQIVAQLDVGIDKYRIGLAQYSEGGRVEFLLNTYKSKEDVLKHIQGSVPLLGGPLQTGSALEFLHKVFVKEDAGSRISQGTPQFAVVITSAKSKDDVTQAAENLKDTGVKVISVGVQNSDREELEVIATSPLVYQVSDGQSISQLHQDITGVLETPVQQQYDSALDAKVPAVCASASVADIVFLVDESSRIGLRNFQLTRTFLLKIVNALDIGPNNVRVGLVLYSDEPRLEFTLTTFVNKSDILNYLTKLPYRGGRPYTGAAIDFLRKKVFTQEAGSRKNQGVQQLAVIITDGQSFDDFIEPASKLRRSGVAVYAVGTTNTSTSSQLDKIASYPPRKHVTNLEYFLQLSNIEWKIKKRLCSEIVLQTFVVPVRSRILKEGCVDTEEADIYFLIDGSGSIYPNDFQDMKVFMNEMISMFQVSANGVRFGVVQYASTPQTEFTIGQYNSVKQLKEAIRVIQQTGGGTNTGDALRYMKSLFAKAAKDRVPQLLIVITDGESQDEVITPAEELRQEGITIFAIGIKNAVRKELKDIAGAEERMFFVNDYDSLKLIKHDIVRDICSPEACKNMRADIIFLVDSSESIRPVDFQKMKDFMQLIVNRSDIGADKVQIGLLQFSSDTKEEFQLNRYDSKADLRTAILGMKQIKTGTLTGKALTIASSYFDETKGGRPRVKQYLIVITDGEAQDTVKEPAKAIRDKGVTIFAIGVLQANNSQLMEIASTQDKVFLEDNFDALAFLEKQILFEICNPEDPCKRTEVADIIFVVHGSSSITDLQFQSMKRIMVAVVNDSMVGKDNVQFGAVVYSTDPQDRFTLNTYSAKSQVREAIFNLRPMSGLTFTARALNFARERFGMAYGGRASSLSVTRILVLITDQPTSPLDRPNLPAAAKSLKQDGISVFAVGVDEASRTELEEIVGERERMFFADSYNELESLHPNLTHTVCDKAKPACGKQQADLIFLVDGSGSISARNFSAMKTFMKEIVDNFIIAQDRVQVGVVQFSEEPRKELYLNEFHSDTAIKEQIDSIVQLKTSTYTGKGLRFVKNLFENANGGRKKQLVSQSLVVITDGHSADQVDEAAIALRNDGIHVFAIGIGIPNSYELLRIAGDARRVYVLENFEMLQTIERKIVGEICELEDPPSQDCNIDISVGIDISRRMKPTSAQHMKQKLQNYLPRLLHRMESLTNISCTADSEINIRFKYQVFAQNGQTLFDSDFEAYNEEIIQKFLAEQTTVDTYLNAEFLQSFWEKSLSLASAKVKVLLVFTDGLDDTIEMLQTTADSLRIKGLDALLMVGLENVQDLNELQEIEFGRGFGYKQPLSIGFPELPNILRKELDVIAERKCCNIFAKCIGEPGFHGITGPPGRKGGIGFRGVPGHPGEEGENGERGPMGINGTQGEGGCPGVKGPKGARGYRGIRGHDGENGIDGLDGEEGSQGLPGSSGEKGSTGRQGRKGPRGEVGERGEPGLRGDHGDPGINNNISGPKGEKGKPGQQGEPGTDGVPGELGEEGTDGAEGRRGPQGLKGDQGDRGEPGYPGDPGLPGSQGQRGLQGVRGPPGPQGIPGPQANPGAQGAAGTPGNPGPKGPKGELGDPGEKGPLGPPGPRGMPGLDGDDGSGPAGSKGAKGETGFPGYPGAQGEDGDPGSRGDRGPKGIRGKRGNAGFPGSEGNPGDQGPPGPQGIKGPKGTTAMSPCELVNFTRENCPCISGTIKCPVYPTELVFAFDMSGDVTPVAFERMKNIVISLLRVIQLSESNCPTGARISIVSYNTNTRYLVRFSEFQTSNLLLEAVQRIPLERSSGRRNIGAAMRFIAKNVFKRVRQGALIRKVAIFFANGPSQDATSINTAVLEFSALDITPVVIAFNEVPNVRRAFSMDDTRRFQLLIWKRPQDERLESITYCTLCYDKCKPDTNCEVTVPPPVMVNMDITYVMDSSRNIDSDEFERAKDFVSAMLDHFVITSQPRDSDEGARVALVQQAPQHFIPNRNMSPVKEEFDLTTYSGKNVMKRHIQKSVHQLEGPSAIGHALQWTIDNIFFQAPEPRQHRVIFTILGSKTSSWDRQKLREISLRAKCQGFIMFTLALGNDITSSELIELSSFPTEQHLVQLGKILKLDMTYAQKFSRVFLNLLKRRMNSYPPPELQEECETLNRGDALQQVAVLERIPFPKFGGIDNGGNLEEPTENRMMKEITEVTQEPVDVSQKEKYDYEENEYFTEDNAEETKLEEYGEAAGMNEENLVETGAAYADYDACIVDHDGGECEDYDLKWYYDKEQKICIEFWYGGCGGNKNRFGTQEECEALCIASP
nr:collagen alpha-6(VI) chain-like [Pelodiscus sinensis]XP_025039335.1 collagen alpha-6(VI) chain-like [Pelodiscus sinensis]XP_025039336.1 collagen alpha-6(VI) chain-like [Pelodiscus sinensis]XP_025039337.1 collagen alpha-6(VI) chain-like [Pelodiscus sinensis]|eukprot:XP_006120973.1 collagen alpha-6(VI) chain-like [Pelodiscus sinensis]